MGNTTVAVIVGAVLHLAGLAAVATLTGVGVIPADVGLPLIAAQVALPTGAGLALVTPGRATTPSGGQDGTASPAGLAGAPTAGTGATLTLTPAQVAAVAANVPNGAMGQPASFQGPGGSTV
jgi:hypothetical protein